MVDRLFHRLLACFGALAAIAFPLATTSAETGVAPDAHAQHDGVRLDAYARNGEITFCFNADSDVKIASEYGVEFKVPRDQAKLWNEAMPKLVAGKKPYFDLPVRIVLKTRDAPHEREISMGLGVCVAATYCTPVNFEIAVPAANSAGTASPACAN
jgi:hypothetical protein